MSIDQWEVPYFLLFYTPSFPHYFGFGLDRGIHTRRRHAYYLGPKNRLTRPRCWCPLNTFQNSPYTALRIPMTLKSALLSYTIPRSNFNGLIGSLIAYFVDENSSLSHNHLQALGRNLRETVHMPLQIVYISYPYLHNLPGSNFRTFKILHWHVKYAVIDIGLYSNVSSILLDIRPSKLIVISCLALWLLWPSVKQAAPLIRFILCSVEDDFFMRLPFMKLSHHAICSIRELVENSHLSDGTWTILPISPPASH